MHLKGVSIDDECLNQCVSVVTISNAFWNEGDVAATAVERMVETVDVHADAREGAECVLVSQVSSRGQWRWEWKEATR